MKKALIIIGLLSAVVLGSIVFLTVNKRQNTSSKFDNSGYILDTDAESGTAKMDQYYFNGGETYKKNSTKDAVDFKTVAGDKVSVPKDSFVHYNDGSMEALTKTVILDTDEADSSARSYYSLPGMTRLVKGGDAYTASYNGYARDFRNIVWKISEKDYMVVSPEIRLVVSGEEAQVFPDYVQVKYKDSGIVFLTTQQGIYSTVSSDAYLELANGIRIYLGSKNLSTEEGIVMNLSQMVVNSEDMVEMAPDEAYKSENTTQPQIIVDSTDGKDGDDGEDGKQGEAGENGEDGEAGKNGAKGETGEEGEDGEDGDEGEAGQAGKAGKAGDAGTAGKAGDAGSNGSNGKDGSNGKAGATGAAGAAGEEGDYGSDGTDASTANLIYSEDKKPEFWTTIKTSTTINEATQAEQGSTADKVLVYVKYNDKEKTWSVNTKSVTLTILETDTGMTVATVVPEEKGISVLQSGFYVPFSGLTPATNYTLVISAEFRDQNDNTVTKDVLTKNFVTESIGVALTQRYVTDSSVDFFLTRTSEDPISSVSIRLYDSEQNPLEESTSTPVIYLIPTDGIPDSSTYATDQKIVYNETNGIFSVDRLQTVGSRFEVVAGKYVKDPGIPSDPGAIQMGGLESDTVYYAQITAYAKGEGDQVTAITDYSFPMVRFKTLKKAPVLDAPFVTVSGYENSFIVSAQGVTDPDHGIISYRYELFAVDDAGAVGTEPVYSVTAATATSVKIPLDKAKVSVGKKYRARIVALFDNNEVELEYPGTMSADFSLEQTWPVAVLEDTRVTASTMEGSLKVTDSNKLITRGGTYEIKVMLQPQSALTRGDNTTYNEQVQIGVVTTDPNEDTYSIPFKAQGLEYNTAYNIIVYATEVTIQENGNSVKKSNVVISSTGISTASYTPIRMHIVHGDRGSQAFRNYLYFSSADWDLDNTNAKVSSVIAGVGNLGHFSSKSMQYLRLELWYAGEKKGFLTIYKPETYAQRTDRDTGYYDFVKTPSAALSCNLYSDLQNPETTIDKKYCKTNGFGKELIISDFKKIMKDNTGQYIETSDPLKYEDLGYTGGVITLKASVYDYTYFTGSTSAAWKKGGEYCNPITVTNDVSFDLEVPKPDFAVISGSDYKQASVIRKSDMIKATALVEQFRADTENKYSNYKDFSGTDLKTDVWDKAEMLNDTAVGLCIIGPEKGLKNYAARVRYTVYSDAALTQQVAQSSWLNVSTTDTDLPSWYFLIDATTMKRGQNFYVKTEAELNSYYADKVEIGGVQYQIAGKIYPTEFVSGILHDQLFTDVTGPISKSFVLNKQVPSFSLVQWEGDAGIGDAADKETVTYLMKINDLDEALDHDDGYADYKVDCNKIILYYDTDATVLHNKITPNPDTATNSIFPYCITNLEIPGRKLLFYKYRLTEEGVGSTAIEAILDKYTSSIMKGNKVIFVGDINPSTGQPYYDLSEQDRKAMYGTTGTVTNYLPCSFDGGDMSVMFWYTDSAASGGTSLRKVDLEMNAYTSAPDEDGSKTVRLTYTYDQFMTGTSVSSSATFYKGLIKFNVLTELDDATVKALSNYNYMRIRIKGYYDDGHYGLTYANSDTVNYAWYVLQAQDQAKYISETGTAVKMEEAIFHTKKVVEYAAGTDELSVYYLYTDPTTKVTSEKVLPLTYSAAGLSKVPRHAQEKTVTSTSNENLLKDVLPTYLPVLNNIGYSEASVKLDFNAQGTLVDDGTGKMITVFYSTDLTALKDTYAGNAGNAKYQLSAAEYESSRYISGLTGNTTYYFKVFGFAGAKGWTLLKKTDNYEYFSFKTIERIPVGKPAKIIYLALPDDALTKKKVQVTFSMTDVAYTDINSSLSTVVLNMKNGTTEVASVQILQAILDAFPKKAGGTPQDGKQTYDVTVDIPFAPADNHVMNGSVTYTFTIDITYKSTSVESTDPVDSKPGRWPTHRVDNEGRNTYLGVVPVVTYSALYSNSQTYSIGDIVSYKDGTAAKALYKCTVNIKTPEVWNASHWEKIMDNAAGKEGLFRIAISGYDRLRLFRTADLSTGTISKSDEAVYYIRLYRKEGDDEVEVKDTSGNPVGKILSRSISNTGYVSYVSSNTCYFEGLTPKEYYKVKVFALWDSNNDGNVTITKKVSSGETDFMNSECYIYETDWKAIPEDSLVFSSMALSPGVTTSYARIGGENLKDVNKISYTLKVNGVIQNTWTLEKGKGADEAHYRKAWTDWAPDTYQTDFYTLNIQGMTDTDSTYELYVTLYTPTTQKSRLAIYGKND